MVIVQKTIPVHQIGEIAKVAKVYPFFTKEQHLSNERLFKINFLGMVIQLFDLIDKIFKNSF